MRSPRCGVTGTSRNGGARWRRNPLGGAGEDGAKKVSGEPREQAHDQERAGIQAENLARPPAGATASQSERDWAWCREALQRGLDPAIVRAHLEERRADDQPNPEYYARHTVERASASLRREIPAQEIER